MLTQYAAEIARYWPYMAMLCALLAMVFGLMLVMRRKRAWDHSIMAHTIFFLLAAASLKAGSTLLSRLIADHHITLIDQGMLGTLTTIGICALALRQLFHLINRLTNSHISRGNDMTSARIVSRILKFALIMLVVLMFGEKLGIGFSGLLAFGGIGGIAIGVAGKDILSNLFSGVMLYFDRPFSIGDWVSSPERDIEGTVVEIGWRLTKIITFDNRPLYVPNSVFSSISVENPGRMTNRRITTTVSLRYDDADKVPAVVDEIRQMLNDDPAIDQSQDLLVYFDNFGTSSLDIMVYCFTRTTHWAEWLSAQQAVFMKIIAIVHAHDADFATTTRSISVDSPLIWQPAPPQSVPGQA